MYNSWTGESVCDWGDLPTVAIGKITPKFSSITCAGSFLYIASDRGLARVGNGKHGSHMGALYASVSASSLENVYRYVMFAGGKLLATSNKILPRVDVLDATSLLVCFMAYLS